MTSGTNAVLCKIPEPLPVIHWGWGDLKSCDIALQGNQGMNLEAKIGFFFGRVPAIICTICTEGTIVPGPPKLTDWEGEAVNHKITAGWYGEWLASLWRISSVTCKRALLVQLNRVQQQIWGKRWRKFRFTKEYQAFSESIPGSLPQILKVMLLESDIFAVSTFLLCETDVETNCWYKPSIIVKTSKIKSSKAAMRVV